MSLYAALGSYNNLYEEKPFFNYKAASYGFVIPFLTVSSICASLRLYVRVYITRCLGWDDYFMLLIFALTWVTNVGVLLLFNYGLGQHFTALGGLKGMSSFVHMFWWVNACYNMSMTAIKLSILFQYLRLLNDQDADRTSSRWVRLAVMCLILITSIWGLVFSILAWVPSLPVSADWNFMNNTAIRYAYGSDDIDTFVMAYVAHGATNMTLDIFVFAIPLFSRSMWAAAGRQRQSRIAMVCLYGLGIMSVICSIVRFASIVEHKATTLPTFDPTWYGPESMMLSAFEVDIATIAASLPVFWPYLCQNLDKIMVTHEIEVKVTENFSQLDDQFDEFGRPMTRLSDSQRSEHNACVPWEGHAPDEGHTADITAGANPPRGSQKMLMRGLSRKPNRNGDLEGGDLARSNTPFDGSRSRSPAGLHSPSRAFFLLRDSKEGLLR